MRKISDKLQKLKEYTSYLKQLQKLNKKSLFQDYISYGAVERYFHLAIEAMLDIGKLIILEEAFEKAEENQEILDILAHHKLISSSLHKNIGGIAGFRNILVHEYAKIDKEEVYKKLQKNLKDFDLFGRAVARYIKRINSKK